MYPNALTNQDRLFEAEQHRRKLMAERILTIDCQVHAYERNKPERPGSGF